MAGPSGNYTRNLIGSCSVSAYSLSDLQENNGLWFVLQDLSVRTEGSFRYVNSLLPPPLSLLSLFFSLVNNPSQSQILLHQRRRAGRNPQRQSLSCPVDLLLRRLYRVVRQEVPWSQGEHAAE